MIKADSETLPQFQECFLLLPDFSAAGSGPPSCDLGTRRAALAAWAGSSLTGASCHTLQTRAKAPRLDLQSLQVKLHSLLFCNNQLGLSELARRERIGNLLSRKKKKAEWGCKITAGKETKRKKSFLLTFEEVEEKSETLWVPEILWLNIIYK